MRMSGMSGRSTANRLANSRPSISGIMVSVITTSTSTSRSTKSERAIALSREHRPDVVLMDLRMPVTDGVEATRIITRELPETRILALTTYDGAADIRRALDAGAVGSLLKDMLLTDVIDAVRAVH